MCVSNDRPVAAVPLSKAAFAACLFYTQAARLCLKNPAAVHLVWLTLPAAVHGAYLSNGWFDAVAWLLLPNAMYAHLHHHGLLSGAFGLTAVEVGRVVQANSHQPAAGASSQHLPPTALLRPGANAELLPRFPQIPWCPLAGAGPSLPHAWPLWVRAQKQWECADSEALTARLLPHARCALLTWQPRFLASLLLRSAHPPHAVVLSLLWRLASLSIPFVQSVQAWLAREACWEACWEPSAWGHAAS